MRFLLSKLRIFLFFPIPYLSQPLNKMVYREETQRLITRRPDTPLAIMQLGLDLSLIHISEPTRP